MIKTLTPEKLQTLFEAIIAQTDLLQFDSNNFIRQTIAGSEIQVPVDIQNILPGKAELYGADESAAQSIMLDSGGLKTIDITCHATTATTFTIEYSYDNSHWYNYYTSGAAETDHHVVPTSGAEYIRVSSAAAGVSGTDTVDLAIGAKP